MIVWCFCVFLNPFTFGHMYKCLGITSFDWITYQRAGSWRKLIILLLLADLYLGMESCELSII